MLENQTILSILVLSSATDHRLQSSEPVIDTPDQDGNDHILFNDTVRWYICNLQASR